MTVTPPPRGRRAWSPERRSAALQRYQRIAEWPLAALSLVFVGAFFTFVVSPDRAARDEPLLTAALTGVWAVFALDYLVGLVLAPDRPRHLRTHIPETLALVVPALRVLLPVLTLVRRLGPWRHRGRLARLAVTYVGGLSVAVIVLAAGAVVLAERGAPGATIESFGDGLWWAVTTSTTVGYGDTVPVTAVGRLVGVVAMAVGIALVGTATASVASWFVDRSRTEHQAGTDDVGILTEEVRALRREIEDLRRALDRP